VTDVGERPLPLAAGAVRAWLTDRELTPVLAYIEQVADEGGPDNLARLSIGLTVLAGWLVTRVELATGTPPHELLDDILRVSGQSDG
jgi:hypothetical protein